MDDNEHLAQKLDEEFRVGLVSIRPFILRLNSVEEAHLCRLWLAKLLNCVDERLLRNRLLRDLTDNVKSGSLRLPFLNPPTGYPLSSLQIDFGDACPQERGDETWSPISFENSNIHDRIYSSECQTSRDSVLPLTPLRRRSEPFTSTRWRKTEEKDHTHKEVPEITEESDQIQSLLNTIASLKAQNEALNHEVRLYQKTSRKTQESLNTVNDEVIALRAKLVELQNINKNIENTYVNKITHSLSLVLEKLQEVSEKNLNLFSFITRLESKITHTGQQSEENKLKNDIRELKNQLADEKKKSEMEIKHLKTIISEKNEQLKRVDLQVKTQCSRMQEEVSNIKSEITQAASEEQSQLKTKIRSLKKDVLHLEKANKKLVAQYESQLQTQKFRKENEQIIKQKPSLTKNASLNLELAVIELEQRYRKIVADLEARSALQRKQDALRIHELEEQLRKENNFNKINYN